VYEASTGEAANHSHRNAEDSMCRKKLLSDPLDIIRCDSSRSYLRNEIRLNTLMHDSEPLSAHERCYYSQVLAKCETRQALFQFHEIAQRSDGIILSRGNLGLDVLPEKMALVQKAVISNCNLMGKPVIITRVVDTMIHAPRPTRSVFP
jgi:hypothetical protein